MIMCEVDGFPVAGCLVFRVGKWAGKTRASTKSSEWMDGLVINKYFIFMGDRSMQTTFLT